MAYIFVFDYEDENSFNEMVYLARVITNAENLEKTEKSSKSASIKCFVCNKYPYLIDDLNTQNFNENVLNQMCEDDIRIFDYVQKLKEVFKNSDEDPRENLFFTSCKQNLGVRYLFDRIFNKINQREDLWKKDEFENDISLNSKNAEEEKKVNSATCNYPFLCCKSRKEEEVNNIEKSIKENSGENFHQYVDVEEEEQQDKYRKIIHRMVHKHTGFKQENVESEKNNPAEEKKENAEENKKGGCIIY